MRWLFVTVFLAALVTPAHADDDKKAPAPKDEPAKANEAKDDAPKAKAKPAPKSKPTVPPPATAVKPDENRVDLFPPSVFGDRGTLRSSESKKAEETHRLSLGNDKSWKAQAVQVGAMAAMFGALVGLCSGGKCMLGDTFTGWLPDAFKADPYSVQPDRPEPKVRQAR